MKPPSEAPSRARRPRTQISKTQKNQKRARLGTPIISLIILASCCQLIATSLSEGSENPFLHAKRLGVSLPRDLITEWKTLRSQRLSFEYKKIKYLARKEVIGLISEGIFTNDKKCKILRRRVKRRWHQKKLEVQHNLNNLNNRHSRVMLSYTTYSTHKRIVNGELAGRRKERDHLKAEIDDKKAQMEHRIKLLKQKIQKMREEHQEINEDYHEKRTILREEKIKYKRRRTKFRFILRAKKARIKLFHKNGSSGRAKIKRYIRKCKQKKMSLLTKLTSVYDVKAQVRRRVALMQGLEPPAVKKKKLPPRLRKLFRTKIYHTKRKFMKKRKSSLFSDLGKKKKKASSLFGGMLGKKRRRRPIRRPSEPVFGSTLRPRRKNFYRGTFRRRRLPRRDNGLFNSFNAPRRSEPRNDGFGGLFNPVKSEKPRSNDFFNMRPKRVPQRRSFFGSGPKRVGGHPGFFGSLKKHRRSSAIFGGMKNLYDTRTQTRTIPVTRTVIEHQPLSPRQRRRKRHQLAIHKTTTSEEYVPDGEKVTYMLNGKPVTEEEFQKLQKQKNAKVEHETVNEKPPKPAAPKSTEKEVYTVDGKEVTAAELAKMRAKGLVE